MIKEDFFWLIIACLIAWPIFILFTFVLYIFKIGRKIIKTVDKTRNYPKHW